jgi:hypothetical protein
MAVGVVGLEDVEAGGRAERELAGVHDVHEV